MLSPVLSLASSSACAARQVPAPRPPPDDAIALFRDRAFVEQAVVLAAPRAGAVRVPLAVAAGIAADDVIVLDAGGVSLSSVKIDGAPGGLALAADAPRAGRFVLTVAYVTDRLRWDAAYTLTAPASRDRAELRGAIAIRNLTGVALRGHAVVVDGPLAAGKPRAAEPIAGLFAG
ncbi:MAG TPA: hypothetical protein VFP84_34675, partial [Kofleriaceae bacterium]|nr:hypothetical protein [Kofleriaceae bacterium]